MDPRLTEEQLRLIELGNMKLWEKMGYVGPIKDIQALVAEVKASWDVIRSLSHIEKNEYYWEKKEGK